MLLGRVLNRVVSTAKVASLPNGQYLNVRLEPGFEQQGVNELIAIDSVQAGPGDLVLILMEGTGARQVVGARFENPLALHAVIVGVVDVVDAVQV